MALLASVLMPPVLLACTDRSRMRCRMLCVSVSAPSAVCTTEMPSWVLRTATLSPPICERRPSEMASPAASSAARLMRKPEESFSSDLLIWPSVTDRLRYALSAAMLLLTRRPMVILLGRGLPAASVLRAKRSLTGHYGRDGGALRRTGVFSTPVRSSGSRPGGGAGDRPVSPGTGHCSRRRSSAGHPVDVALLLVPGADPAVGGDRSALPH